MLPPTVAHGLLVEFLDFEFWATMADTPLAGHSYRFSVSEPAVNRYGRGGHFAPHRDMLALTLNVLLSTGFEGGGTAFWRQV